MNKHINFLTIVLLFIAMMPIVYPLSISDTSALYRFEEGSGTNATDSSGNENHGIITGATYVSSKGGNGTGNHSLSFDGIDNNIIIADDDKLDLTFDLSYCAWINGNQDYGSDLYLIDKTIYGMELRQGDDIIRCFIDGNKPVSTTSFTDNVPHHVCCVNTLDTITNISNTSIFIDTILENSVISTQTGLFANAVDLVIGSKVGGSRFWDGGIDEVVFFDFALSHEERVDIFNNGISEIELSNPPNSTLIFPTDNTITEEKDITFECLSQDDYNLTDVTLYHNLSGTFIANETKSISGTSVTSYFNIEIPFNNTIIWNCESTDNESQSAFADADFTLTTNQTFIINDTTSPVLSLISPQNNTINGTFPLNIVFNIADDSSNATCILTNSTYIFDEKTILMGINYVTLQFENESEISQNFPNLELTCYDNTENNNSATMLLNYTIDKVLPLMFIILPELNATFNKVYTGSTPIYTTCYDDNVYRLNVTISNSSDVIFSEQDMLPVGNTLVINSVLNFENLGTGTYQKSDFCADTHTAKSIPNYNVFKRSYEQEKGIRWVTPTGNEFELKCSYSEGILNYGSYKSPDDDRYIFYYIINDTEDGSSFDIECELENKKFAVDYLPNSPIPAPHFITELNWIDFILVNDADAEYEVSLNQNNNYVIEISTTTTNLTFGSVGELNTIEIISQITIVFELPREDEFVLGVCPVDSLPRAIMFMFFFLLSFLIMGIGYTLRNGLIGVIGSIMLIGMGVFTWFCLAFVSLIVMGLGVIMMSMFVFKGVNAFR